MCDGMEPVVGAHSVRRVALSAGGRALGSACKRILGVSLSLFWRPETSAEPTTKISVAPSSRGERPNVSFPYMVRIRPAPCRTVVIRFCETRRRGVLTAVPVPSGLFQAGHTRRIGSIGELAMCVATGP